MLSFMGLSLVKHFNVFQTFYGNWELEIYHGSLPLLDISWLFHWLLKTWQGLTASDYIIRF